MIHAVFHRPTRTLKILDLSVQRFSYTADGAAWGNLPGNQGEPPYGRHCCIAPGHYSISRIDWVSPPTSATGSVEICISDLTDRDIARLIAAEKAVDQGGALIIGGIVGATNGLDLYGRDDISIHGGGTRLNPKAFSPRQPLSRTVGGIRMYNADVIELANYLDIHLKSGRMVILTCIGDTPTGVFA